MPRFWGEVGAVGLDLTTEQEHGVIKVAALIEDGAELLGQEQVGRRGLDLGEDVKTVEQIPFSCRLRRLPAPCRGRQ